MTAQSWVSTGTEENIREALNEGFWEFPSGEQLDKNAGRANTGEVLYFYCKAPIAGVVAAAEITEEPESIEEQHNWPDEQGPLGHRVYFNQIGRTLGDWKKECYKTSDIQIGFGFGSIPPENPTRQDLKKKFDI